MTGCIKNAPFAQILSNLSYLLCLSTQMIRSSVNKALSEPHLTKVQMKYLLLFYVLKSNQMRQSAIFMHF